MLLEGGTVGGLRQVGGGGEWADGVVDWPNAWTFSWRVTPPTVVIPGSSVTTTLVAWPFWSGVEYTTFTL